MPPRYKTLPTVPAPPAEPAVSFPKEYRRWLHSKSMVIPDKGHGLYGFHHVYVEPRALDAYLVTVIDHGMSALSDGE